MANLTEVQLPNGTTYKLVDDESGYITEAEVEGMIGDKADKTLVSYCSCSTAAATAQKEVVAPEGWELETGRIIAVKFVNTNTANNPTLKVGTADAKGIYYNNAVVTTGSLFAGGEAGKVTLYIYDGTRFVWLGHSIDNNTTYSAMSVSELTTGTATSLRTVRADYLKTGIKELIRSTKKKYLLMGDSYGGYSSGGETYSWINDVISLTGIDGVNLSQGNIGFRPAHDNISSFYKLLNDAISRDALGDLAEYTDIIVCGGANDISSVSLEEITKSQIVTWIGDFVTLCNDNFPNANIYIGMIGQVRSNNYARDYYDVLEAYRECGKYGASYLENVEYILGCEHIKADDGIHPTPDGFYELAKYLSEAVINKSCNVSRPLRESASLPILPASIGTWALTPIVALSQNNGHQKAIYKQYANGITLSNANQVSIDNLVADADVDGYKYIGICELQLGHVKGGTNKLNVWHPYYVGTANVTLQTVAFKYINLECPLALVTGRLYICLPSSSTSLRQFAGETAYASDDLLYIMLNNFSIEIDGSNYNGW